MNRYDDSSLDDALGQMIRWSLRGNTASVAPSRAVWQRLAQSVQMAGAARGERRLRRALRALRRTICEAWQTLDENTMSSEGMWGEPLSPSRRALQLAREQLINVWPTFGMMKMPIY
ncbi:MAG: hypothetical protein ABI874_06500 [Chloroflexota bacterium]